MTPTEIAQQEWQKNIIDNGSQESNAQILQYIQVVRPDIKEYHPRDGFEWCGAFAARCFQGIRPWLLQHFFASTYRMDCYGRGEPAVMEGPHGEQLRWDPGKDGDRLYGRLDEASTDFPFPVLPNDILLLGTHGYGTHIAIAATAIAAAQQTIATLGGNQAGFLLDGRFAHGVTRREFNLGRFWGGTRTGRMHIRRVIRPAPGDFLS